MYKLAQQALEEKTALLALLLHKHLLTEQPPAKAGGLV
jgi:hypothetical protein